MKTTPEDRARLLALTTSYAATLTRWREGGGAHSYESAKLHTLRHDIAKATTALLPDLLDDLATAVVVRNATARLLAAESARVGELTAELDHVKARRDLEETMERVALTIAERDARTIAALESERDTLAAKLAEVRALHVEGRAFVRPGGIDRMCSCGRMWPCPTVAILDLDGGE